MSPVRLGVLQRTVLLCWEQMETILDLPSIFTLEQEGIRPGNDMIYGPQSIVGTNT